MYVDDPLSSILMQKLVDSVSGTLPPYTPREISGRIQLEGKATAVVGMRRAGKTTFLHQLRQERLTHGVVRESLPYINFEDERLAGLSADRLNGLVEEYYRRFPELRASETVTWCFDEIQVVPGWERFVRRLIDSENAEIFVTGSSAALLSREIATALRGRAWEVILHPFSFREALLHNGLAVPDRTDQLTSQQRSQLERSFLDYLQVGGFPEAQGLDTASRRQLLSDYVDVAMLRDVVERHGVTNVAGLRWLVRHLLANAAGRFSVEKFFRALRSQGFSISKDTVHRLLAHLEDCFLVRTAWMESNSERQRMVNPRKSYPADPALIPLFDRTGRANLGHALETVILIELERRRASITYVRTSEDHEVDFLARFPDGRSELIQVCADLSSQETATRELRSLEGAGQAFPSAARRLLMLTHDQAPREIPDGVILQPAYEWLLSSPESSSTPAR